MDYIVRITRTFAVALVLAVTAPGLWATGAEEDATAADKQYVTDPVTGKEVTAPEYGGTLTFADRGRWRSAPMTMYHGHALSQQQCRHRETGRR